MEAGYLPGMGRVVSRPLSNYVVIDVETTGLDPEKDRIIELAAVRVVRNEVVDTFSSLVNPDFEISGFISNLTGITNDMLADAPRIQDILPTYLDFIGDAVVLGHNVVFDVKFLHCACMRCFSDGFPNNFADTLRWSRRLFPEYRSHKLKDLIAQGESAGIVIGDYTIPVDNNGNVSGGLKVSGFRPYLGLGFGRAVPKKRVGVMFELGVQFHGKPEVYTDSGDVKDLLNEIDEDDTFTKIMDKLTVYPVMKIRICGRIF